MKQPVNHLTTIRLNDVQLAWLREEAHRQDRSIGWIIRTIVEDARQRDYALARQKMAAQ